VTVVNFSYPPNVRFTCNHCGICCGDTPRKTRHVLLLKADAERIAKNTKLAVEGFARETAGKAPYVYEMLKDAETGKCVFHKDDQCAVYEVRPLICRFYPFSLALENGTYVFKVTDECPQVSLARGEGGEPLGFSYFKRLWDLACAELGFE
jgi:Fe-S-cluster containining protein